ncbi:cobalamin biosynthesis protein CbiX [Streptacidiphilus sp. P02-A3a]|uniref:cobalamin biosynthesis protein CbiX n=1 Tax=Streptacidiphilus sp. P02-A3a TaxID=2704468 RepID=UPI0015FDB866|nr:cobalamin biosynthesis protein CbiX [Streptacidiphilus sp. P02-A3a]QMU69564.1 cobalamin biosynthesis protein CbiX [Streptacidiphilus sp. P02-A3a]
MNAVPPGPFRLIAVGGHESAFGRLLPHPPTHDTAPVPAGRELAAAVRQSLATGVPPVLVVPMTLGRDPELAAEAARALRPIAAEQPGRVALAEPFGSTEHLVGWLRAAAGRGAAADRALLLTAPAADPQADAELYRVARLVRQFGRHRLVEVAFTDGDPSPAEGVDRCHRLGAAEVLLLPAGFGPAEPPPGSGATGSGPLLGPAAVRAVLAARSEDARVRLRHGDDGIAAALAAAHGHSHDHPHDHDHDPPEARQPRQHGHPHDRAPAHTH